MSTKTVFNAFRARAAFAVLCLLLAGTAAQAANTAIEPVPRPDDWWQKRHASMNDRVKQGNVDLIFVGDSITQGWEGGGKDVWEQFYGDRNAVNLGIGGDQTQHVLWRLDNGNIDGIHPKAAVIMIGTNNFKANTAEEIGEGITAIVTKLRTKLPETKILLLAIFPRGEHPGEDREKLAKASAIAAATADGKNVFYLDIGKEFLTGDGTLPKAIMADFLHPGAEGYLIEARAIEPMVSQLLGETAAGKLPKGFVKLFNDKDLTGWKGLVENPFKRDALPESELAAKQKEADQQLEHWHIEDGVIHYDGHGQNLCTARYYDDFEMLVDWKIQPNGDSGIYLRGAPQVQIWDPANPNEKLGASVGSGGLYNNKKPENPSKPLVKADHPTGEWNTFRIKMIGDKVTVWLNDVLVTDNTVLENYWDYTKPLFESGEIQLQNHSSELWFKNIWIREIPRGDGWKDLFNGKDLSGWEEINGNKDKPSWAVENGQLYTTGEKGGGWISTKDEYSDYELECEFKIPQNGNSGIYIRSPHGNGNPTFDGNEVQVLDDAGPEYHAPNAEIQPWQYCGSLYHTAVPSKHVSLPAGTWQKMYVKVVGPLITVRLNGFEIVNDDMSKHPDLLKEHPGLANSKGFIGFQNHGTRLDYRNIRIHPLN